MRSCLALSLLFLLRNNGRFSDLIFPRERCRRRHERHLGFGQYRGGGRRDRNRNRDRRR